MNVPARPLRYHMGDIIAGKYRLTEALGEGGMGEVWEGVNIVLDATVAIKLMKPELSDEVLRQRLLQEARTAAALNHPAIIRVFDVGETSAGEPYVVMERLHGKSLRHLIDDDKRPDIVEVVQALLPILDALSLAHARGLVHRDVKPDNIFLAEISPERIQPKLLDFGVVKAQALQRYLTHTGTVVGSPPYMSPEQARGDDDIDHLADLWAVCVVLYEAIAGAVPFDAANYNALLRRIVEEEPGPLPCTDPEVMSLEPIVMQGLHKDREQRWQSAEALGRALAMWLVKLGVAEDATGRRVSGRWLASDRKSSTDRRRVSLADVDGIDVLELVSTPTVGTDLYGEVDQLRLDRQSAPTLPRYQLRRSRARTLAIGAGLLVLMCVLAVFGFMSGGDDGANVDVEAAREGGEDRAPSGTESVSTASEPGGHAASVSGARAPAVSLQPAPASADAVESESGGQAGVPSSRMKLPAKKPKATERSAATKPKEQRPTKSPPTKSPSPDHGLKDPY